MKDKFFAFLPITIIVIVTIAVCFGVNFATDFGPGQKYAPGGSEAVTVDNGTTTDSSTDGTTTDSSTDGATTDGSATTDGATTDGATTDGSATTGADAGAPADTSSTK